MSTEGAQVRTARARTEKQRRKRAAVQINWVCSAFTQTVNLVVVRNLSIHAVLPADGSGQLPDLVWCFTLSGT